MQYIQTKKIIDIPFTHNKNIEYYIDLFINNVDTQLYINSNHYLISLKDYNGIYVKYIVNNSKIIITERYIIADILINILKQYNNLHIKKIIY